MLYLKTQLHHTKHLRHLLLIGVHVQIHLLISKYQIVLNVYKKKKTTNLKKFPYLRL